MGVPASSVQRNFERRKLALDDCGRAYGTSCIHEHSCIRCPMLGVDPAQRHRLRGIHASLTARIAEAEREGWTGEAEGLKIRKHGDWDRQFHFRIV